MAKITLNDLANITGNETAAIAAINENNDLLEAAIENTLSRDGTSPNAMNNDLDMNSYDLINVGLINGHDATTFVGPTGATGPQGPAGADGTNGTNGADGADGTSFTWKGTYSGATAYVANDVVSDQSSSWIALQATTGNAPPTLPTTSNVYWQLMSQKGADGAGTGTVTSVSVVSANGLAGSVATATSTPAITLSTTITGVLKGNGTAISAATAGTDYYNPGGTDVAVADGGTGSSTASGARTNLGLVIGTDVQAYDADLATIAGLTATTDNFIQSKSSAWSSRTPTQVTADLINFVGDSGAGGTKGLVPAPAAGDAAANKFLKANGTWTAVSASGITLGTPVATTSGTSIDFTGIPSTAKRISINFNGVSTNGTSNQLIQLGDSGGIETTGYLGAGGFGISANFGGGNYTTGFGIPNGSAASVLHGTVFLTLENSTNNTWVCNGTLATSNALAIFFTAGTKSTSATLDRVRITTVNGTDTFDAGEINITYE